MNIGAWWCWFNGGLPNKHEELNQCCFNVGPAHRPWAIFETTWFQASCLLGCRRHAIDAGQALGQQWLNICGSGQSEVRVHCATEGDPYKRCVLIGYIVGLDSIDLYLHFCVQ